jgi:hypothetical protein
MLEISISFINLKRIRPTPLGKKYAVCVVVNDQSIIGVELKMLTDRFVICGLGGFVQDLLC